jgi:hypothetical protein
MPLLVPSMLLFWIARRRLVGVDAGGWMSARDTSRAMGARRLQARQLDDGAGASRKKRTKHKPTDHHRSAVPRQLVRLCNLFVERVQNPTDNYTMFDNPSAQTRYVESLTVNRLMQSRIHSTEFR